MAHPLLLLEIAAASIEGLNITQYGPSSLLANTTIYVGGSEFKLDTLISSKNNYSLESREFLPGTSLPKICPELHINVDHTFCMGFEDDIQIIPRSLAAGEDWLARYIVFLRKQRVGLIARKWPGKSWRHGAAARHQKSLEELARSRPSAFSNLLVKAASSEPEATETIRQLDLRLRPGTTAPRNLRQGCYCGGEDGRRNLTLKECHWLEVSQFLNMEKQEETFFHQLASKGIICCGKIKNCGLPMKKP